VRQVFEVFDRSKSALAVVKYFDAHGLTIPTRRGVMVKEKWTLS
jgi:hypothetical protein